MSLLAPTPRYPHSSADSCPDTGEEPIVAASGAPNPHAFLVRYTRVYDKARAEGAGMAEAMRLADAKLVHDLEKRHQGGDGGYPRGSWPRA
jgi:hypothetical protein